MAKMVKCFAHETRDVLREHDRDWRLVAVVALTEMAPHSATAINPRYEEVRELYFERLER